MKIRINKLVSRILVGVMTIALMGNTFMSADKTLAAGSTFDAPEINVYYRTHIQNVGWEGEESDVTTWKQNGRMSGTSGRALRLEGINIMLSPNTLCPELDLGIQYTTHCQDYGWLPWSADGDISGTEGESKRLEAIEIQLTGEHKDLYDVYYRVHAQDFGWLDWAKNGAPAGTAGKAKRLEGIQIVVVKAGSEINYNMDDIVSDVDSAFVAAPGLSPVVNYENTDNENPVIPGEDTPNVIYKTHVQNDGWQKWKYNGQLSGTYGRSLRLEGIRIKLGNKPCDGGIVYTTHVQDYGWQSDIDKIDNWTSNGAISGTEGKAKRLEAICIALTGEMADTYDVYYRVHAQDFGWLDWAKNGEPAGTAGKAKRLEGIEICLVEKGGEAPGPTDRPYVCPEPTEPEGDSDNKPSDDFDIPVEGEPIIPGTPTTSTDPKDILNSAQLYAPLYTGDSEIDARVQEILGQIITEDMSTYEKTLAIYNWIMDNNYYAWHASNYRGNYISDYDTWCVSQSYSSLCLGYGSCVNYASAFVVLTRAIGLDSYKIYGALNNGNVNRDHGWAVVNINGTLYTFDPQLSDEAVGNGWGSAMDYFCKSDDDSDIKGYYINVDDEGLTRKDYIEGFNYFKQY
ncbi:MAG: hypothetical protein IJX85_12025 [Lachnospiraceae bacterium]|nr:hypothetical protein [Lachnospiraceae bacterium]